MADEVIEQANTSKARHHNEGLRKSCDCPRRNWPKCPHAWHLNFKPRGGQPWRFSLDVEVGRHLKTKDEAETEAAHIRSAILAGTFIRAADRRKTAAAAPPATASAITLAQFGQTYLERRGKAATTDDRSHLNRLAAFVLSGPTGGRAFGEKAIGAITEDDCEAFFAQLRHEGRSAATRNKYRLFLSAMFRWAMKKGYLAQSPIAHSETIKHESEKSARRSRRLTPDVLNDQGEVTREGEERRLLAVASPALQRLIIGAVETCCRRGELLSLRWADVDLTRRELKVAGRSTTYRRCSGTPT